MVAVIVDDPGIHSSQGEQDSRRYAKFARVPCVGPSDSQEAKDLVGVALAVSEQFDVPTMLRSTTRIAHAHSVVEVTPQQGDAPRVDKPSYKVNAAKYVMTPANARDRRPVMEERTRRLADFDTFPWNVIEPGDTALGIVANGVAYQYAREVFPRASYLKLGMSYPIPTKLVASFASR